LCAIPGLRSETWGTQLWWKNKHQDLGHPTRIADAVLAGDS
jgi:hypothetical protein